MTTPLTVEQLKPRLGQLTLLDVRSPGEYAGGHIPGALSIPLDQLDRALPALRAADGRKELAVVCAAGQRAQTACRQLADAGITALVVTGDTNAWTGARWLSAAVGGGPVFSALTDSCAMGAMLGKLPYNRPRPGTPIVNDTLAALGHRDRRGHRDHRDHRDRRGHRDRCCPGGPCPPPGQGPPGRHPYRNPLRPHLHRHAHPRSVPRQVREETPRGRPSPAGGRPPPTPRRSHPPRAPSPPPARQAQAGCGTAPS
ncbi:rhodanese-like domain-containing protein [Kitasatospora sp. NPDC004669]|uniref:rhodanese-like domain-containing protein n=1 Tax=Kitasatospora sp. NPDC004669 TaxID=3154555 RepID=UPI0033BBB8C2